MATYIPNATQTTEPVESRTVESAALEFRTLKASVNSRVATVQSNLDAETTARIAGDANLQAQNNAQDVRLTAIENALPFIGEGGLPGTVYVQRLSGTGAQTVFTLNTAPQSNNVVDIYVNGLYQNKDTFSVAGAVITFSEAPPAGTDNIEVQVTVTIALGETDASLVTYNTTTVEAQLDAISAASGSSLVGFQQSGAGAVVRTAQDKMREWVSVKDFGAVGDGVTDDTDAFAAAATYINTQGGGRLVIPAGTYIVGRQTFAGAGGMGYAYRAADIIKIENCTRPVVIEFQGAVLKQPAGLRFGSFDPVTGAPYTPGGMPFIDVNYAADPGVMLRVLNNTGGVSIVGRGELDGNNTNMIIGGQWGDTGYQRLSYGIQEYNNASFYVENIYTHHHGTDGIICGYTGAVEGGPATPKTLIGVVSEYNGRQGLSWVGGAGLTAINCKFNRTGRAVNAGTGVALRSAPGAGIDIEAEGSVVRNGVFINCEAINNSGPAMVAYSGDSADVQFINCRFGGEVWPKMPGFKFTHCKFYGPIVAQFAHIDPSQATSFSGCLFTDVPIGDYTMPASLGASAFESPMSAPVYYSECTFNYTRVRPGALSWAVLRDCRFNMSFGTTAVANQDYAMLLWSATLQNCTFDANITTNAPADGFYIAGTQDVKTVGINTLTNTAGIIRWDSWSVYAGGYVGPLGHAGATKNGIQALSLFPSAWHSQHYGTLDIYAGAAPPVSGTYKRGDRVINQSPSVGLPKGWICTEAGTPGTWVSEGNL